jgi:hypothetical protein
MMLRITRYLTATISLSCRTEFGRAQSQSNSQQRSNRKQRYRNKNQNKKKEPRRKTPKGPQASNATTNAYLTVNQLSTFLDFSGNNNFSRHARLTRTAETPQRHTHTVLRPHTCPGPSCRLDAAGTCPVACMPNSLRPHCAPMQVILALQQHQHRGQHEFTLTAFSLASQPQCCPR